MEIFFLNSPLQSVICFTETIEIHLPEESYACFVSVAEVSDL
jgi:hypothetical protein